jgi:DNA-binding NarL/FixJ family response regulator
MKRLRILLADDHEMVRHGLRAVIEEQHGWEVCGEARTGREAVARALELRPDVVVMDFTMPELNGMDATREIRAVLPRTQVLILTMHESEELVPEVLAAGALGYMLKSDAGGALVNAIQSLADQKPYFTSKISALVLKGYLNPRTREISTLTPREREVVQMVAEGKSTKEVAEKLKISAKTADTHRTNVMRKLKLHSVSELVRFAIRNKLVEP